MARNLSSPRHIERRKRMDRALQLRARGKLYREIAAELECSEATAHDLVKTAMAEVPRESAELLFGIENDRLDMAQKALDPAVAEGDVKAIEAWIKLHDRRVKLFHLDKVHGGSADTGDSVIERLAQAVSDAHEKVNSDDDSG